ncbi:Putative protein [Zobellia galactanivorans]|uniref:Uncharacterized protein n=1 Tax=Zobellia galactanivorans (strain DSM 12802 / CCUG 47099 / CIP 106680 / NCIMB 13871 / Dsij) TaxID=63186 RepID=G0L4H7_ZOBGA|nr:Putative protein [Zobellia galactanivorans]
MFLKYNRRQCAKKYYINIAKIYHIGPIRIEPRTITIPRKAVMPNITLYFVLSDFSRRSNLSSTFSMLLSDI